MPESALELFRDACGLPAPLALECQDASRTIGGSDTHQIDCPFALVGRDPQSDLVLKGAEVSRRHAFFQVVEGRLFCIDLNSRTQLHWEGETERRVHGWLDPGCTVRIGPYAIRRLGTDLPEDHSWANPDYSPLQEIAKTDSCSLPRAGLELPIRIGEGETLWRMDSQVALIGRSESCQVMLLDPSVSRFHASFVRTSKGIWVVDLQSREGVLINGVNVRWAWLEDGDTVRIGRFTFILRYETVPDQISRRDVPLEAGASPRAPSGVDSRKSVTHTVKGGTTLAVRSRNRSATLAPVADSSRVLTPDLLAPRRAPEWEGAIAVPPQQLAMWQQQMQMMESFHQDMILMVQMFVAMHREHRVAIRDELDRVQKLTRKLSRLQGKLAATAGSAQVNSSPPSDKPGPDARTAKRSGGNGPAPARAVTPPSEARAGKRNVGKPPDATPRSAAGAPTTPTPDHSRETLEPRPTAGSHADLHTHLTQRITELQRERQGYWQRILSAINK
jgi:pSer/pThr/pTyr-binding forkhead associated (FHA) protein